MNAMSKNLLAALTLALTLGGAGGAWAQDLPTVSIGTPTVNLPNVSIPITVTGTITNSPLVVKVSFSRNRGLEFTDEVKDFPVTASGTVNYVVGRKFDTIGLDEPASVEISNNPAYTVGTRSQSVHLYDARPTFALTSLAESGGDFVATVSRCGTFTNLANPKFGTQDVDVTITSTAARNEASVIPNSKSRTGAQLFGTGATSLEFRFSRITSRRGGDTVTASLAATTAIRIPNSPADCHPTPGSVGVSKTTGTSTATFPAPVNPPTLTLNVPYHETTSASIPFGITPSFSSSSSYSVTVELKSTVNSVDTIDSTTSVEIQANSTDEVEGSLTRRQNIIGVEGVSVRITGAGPSSSYLCVLCSSGVESISFAERGGNSNVYDPLPAFGIKSISANGVVLTRLGNNTDERTVTVSVISDRNTEPTFLPNSTATVTFPAGDSNDQTARPSRNPGSLGGDTVTATITAITGGNSLVRSDTNAAVGTQTLADGFMGGPMGTEPNGVRYVALVPELARVEVIGDTRGNDGSITFTLSRFGNTTPGGALTKALRVLVDVASLQSYVNVTDNDGTDSDDANCDPDDAKVTAARAAYPGKDICIVSFAADATQATLTFPREANFPAGTGDTVTAIIRNDAEAATDNRVTDNTGYIAGGVYYWPATVTATVPPIEVELSLDWVTDGSDNGKIVVTIDRTGGPGAIDDIPYTITEDVTVVDGATAGLTGTTGLDFDLAEGQTRLTREFPLVSGHSLAGTVTAAITESPATPKAYIVNGSGDSVTLEDPLPWFELAATDAVEQDGDELEITLVRLGNNEAATDVTVSVTSAGGHIDQGEHTARFEDADMEVTLDLRTNLVDGDAVTVRIVENPGSYQVSADKRTETIAIERDGLPTFRISKFEVDDSDDTRVLVEVERLGGKRDGRRHGKPWDITNPAVDGRRLLDSAADPVSLAFSFPAPADPDNPTDAELRKVDDGGPQTSTATPWARP